MVQKSFCFFFGSQKKILAFILADSSFIANTAVHFNRDYNGFRYTYYDSNGNLVTDRGPAQITRHQATVKGLGTAIGRWANGGSLQDKQPNQ